MNNKVVVSKEASLFYSMCALLKCATNYADYLLNTPETSVHRDIKHELKLVNARVSNFFKIIERDLDESDKKAWVTDWERDPMSAATIFAQWADMNDEQRELLENFSIELKAGNIQFVPE